MRDLGVLSPRQLCCSKLVAAGGKPYIFMVSCVAFYVDLGAIDGLSILVLTDYSSCCLMILRFLLTIDSLVKLWAGKTTV